MGDSSQKQALQNRSEIPEGATRLLRESDVAATSQVRGTVGEGFGDHSAR